MEKNVGAQSGEASVSQKDRLKQKDDKAKDTYRSRSEQKSSQTGPRHMGSSFLSQKVSSEMRSRR